MGVDKRLCRVLTNINPCVVSKSDSDHGSGYYSHRTLGLAPAGTICHGTRSLGHYFIFKCRFHKLTNNGDERQTSESKFTSMDNLLLVCRLISFIFPVYCLHRLLCGRQIEIVILKL